MKPFCSFYSSTFCCLLQRLADALEFPVVFASSDAVFEQNLIDFLLFFKGSLFVPVVWSLSIGNLKLRFRMRFIAPGRTLPWTNSREIIATSRHHTNWWGKIPPPPPPSGARFPLPSGARFTTAMFEARTTVHGFV